MKSNFELSEEKSIIFAIEPEPAMQKLIEDSLRPSTLPVHFFPALELLAINPLNWNCVGIIVNIEILQYLERNYIQNLKTLFPDVPIVGLKTAGIPSYKPTDGLNGVLESPINKQDLYRFLGINGYSDIPPADQENGQPHISSEDSEYLAGFFCLAEEINMDENIISSMLNSFLARGAAFLDTLQTALTEDNKVIIERTTHALKGMSGNMRFQGLGQLNDQFDVAVKENNNSKAKELLGRLWEEFNHLKSAIKTTVPTA